MVDDRTDPSEQIPEADLLEQQTPIDPPPLTDSEDAPAHAEPRPDFDPGVATSLADEADRLEQATTLPGSDQDDYYPHGASDSGGGMTDPLIDVAVRVHRDFADDATLTDVLTVIEGCRRDLDTPSAAALPELIERLARQRLTDKVSSQAS
jgi:hypothetical protein